MNRDNKNFNPKSASLLQLYQYLSPQHYLLLFIGIIAALATGICKETNVFIL